MNNTTAPTVPTDRKHNVIVMSILEVRNAVSEMYEEIMRDNVPLYICQGLNENDIPEIIYQKGIARLSPSELAEVALPWSKLIIESSEDAINILMYVPRDNMQPLIFPLLSEGMNKDLLTGNELLCTK
jgi:hypothetical protein